MPALIAIVIILVLFSTLASIAGSVAVITLWEHLIRWVKGLLGKRRSKEPHINDNFKDFIMMELAYLQNLPWAENKNIAKSIFPYTLIEAVNILKNSELKNDIKDFASTGKNANKMINKLIKKRNEYRKVKR